MSLTDKLLNEFKQNITELSLAPYGDGRFEVSVDGNTVYSKLETGEFPDEGKVVEQIASMK